MDYEYEASGTIITTISSIVRIDLSIIVFTEKMVRYDVVDRPEALYYRLITRGRVEVETHEELPS